ncbi:hypothetical protein [Streptomyces sp. NPDC052012]|uniref:Rv1733c family protein n=1 Tax=Streptomyces sp. NPDC052012 TaxID=3155051 RepID=UPI00344D4F77
MARTRGARLPRVRLWRWRRNPLRRRSDVIEAWLLLATFVLALLAAVFAGLLGARAVDASLDERRAQTRAVPAVLTKDAADALPAPVSEEGAGHVWAPVRWTAPDGTSRTGRAKTEPGEKAGSPVTVWTDRTGRLVTKPPEGAEARFQIVMAGVTVAVASGGLLLCGGGVVRVRMRRRRLDRWEAEWRQVEPMWRKRMTG